MNGGTMKEKKLNQLEYVAILQMLKTMLEQGIISLTIADKTANNLLLKHGLTSIFLW